jgi:hypothetical protein
VGFDGEGGADGSALYFQKKDMMFVRSNSMSSWLTTFAMLLLMFVVVCPLTSTPTAVANGKMHSLHADAIAVVMAHVDLRRPPIGATTPANEIQYNANVSEVVELTCSRLC